MQILRFGTAPDRGAFSHGLRTNRVRQAGSVGAGAQVASWVGWVIEAADNALEPIDRRRRSIVSEFDTQVRNVMTTELVVIEQNEKLAKADQLMRDHRLRHILVVDEEGLLQGVLSQRDIFHGGLLKALGYGTRAKQQALDSLLVKEAMKAEPVTTTPTTALRAAATIMVERKLGCLPVLDGELLVGILTEGDFALVIAGLKPTAGSA